MINMWTGERVNLMSIRNIGFILGLLLPVSVTAAPITLPTTYDQLAVAGATTSVGNQTYSQFQGLWGNGAPGTGPNGLSGIAVSGAFNGSEFGLLFQGVSGPLAFAHDPSAGPGASFGGSLIYFASAPAGNLIDDFTISYVGSQSGTSSFDVNGALQDPSFHVVGSFSFNTASGSAHVVLSTPLPEVRVFTSVTLSAGVPIFGGSPGSADLTSLQETFSEAGAHAIPEPATLGLVGMGLVTFLLLQRRPRTKTGPV
jgi:PEP-CTERM motif